MPTLTYSKSSIHNLRGGQAINLVNSTFLSEIEWRFQAIDLLREFVIDYWCDEGVGFEVNKMDCLNNHYIINFDNGHYISFTVEGR